MTMRPQKVMMLIFALLHLLGSGDSFSQDEITKENIAECRQELIKNCETISFHSGKFSLKGFSLTPDSPGLYPAIIFNHGDSEGLILLQGMPIKEAELYKNYYLKRARAINFHAHYQYAKLLHDHPYIRDAIGWGNIVPKEEFKSFSPESQWNYKPYDLLRKIRIPVLSIFGENDNFINAIEDAKLYKKALNKAGNKHFIVKVFPNADHSLGQEENGVCRFTPGVLDLAVDWLSELKNDKKTDLKGPYLGQKPPGMTPEIFAPGIVSTEFEEFGCSFTPDGTEFYFTRTMTDTQNQQERMTIMVSRLSDSGWQKPEVAPFCDEKYNEGEPNFSPAGNLVLYGRLLQLEDGSQDPRVIIAERKENGWGKPVDLMHGMFASMTSDSVIYYTDVSEGHSKGDIYRITYSHVGCYTPDKLSGKINSPQQDAHPFVTPIGDMLIFDSNRPGGYGDNDLYICFRKDDGGWGDPVNMGAVVNTQEYDAIPYLTPDYKYLFFFRDNDIYWADARFIEDLKRE